MTNKCDECKTSNYTECCCQFDCLEYINRGGCLKALRRLNSWNNEKCGFAKNKQFGCLNTLRHIDSCGCFTNVIHTKIHLKCPCCREIVKNNILTNKK